MDLLLIFPPKTAGLAYGSDEQFKALDIGVYPPLGLIYVATYIKKYSVYNAEIMDAVCEKMDYAQIAEFIQKKNPKAVGIYTSSFTIYDSYKTAKLVKTINPKIKIILGGPHIEIYPNESLGFPETDYVVIGEGELTMTELLDCFNGKRDVNSVKGIGYKKDGKFIFTEKRPMISALDGLPFPDRSLTRYNKYYSFIGNNKLATTIMSSRGCPQKCSFCYIPYQGTLRLRSAKSVVDEIAQCMDIGIREFFFFDENFTINKDIVTGICREIISRNLRIVFYIRSRIDTVDEELLRYLKAAGCKRIQFGVESGSDRILEKMNKKVNKKRIKDAFGLVKKYGIPVYADLMLGYPGETRNEMHETIRFARELDPDFVQYGITMYLPKTKIYEDALRDGILKNDIWREAAENPEKDLSYFIASADYGRDELEKIQRTAYLDFYFRIGYIVKRIFKIRGIWELLRQAKAALYLTGTALWRK